MTAEPRLDATSHATWCSVCGVPSPDDYRDPDWPAAHRDTTGHTTHRRSWTVETWEGK